MICSLCHADVPQWLWPEPNVPGGHHVIIDGPMTVRTVADDPTMPPDRVRVLAEQTVTFALCRDVPREGGHAIDVPVAGELRSETFRHEWPDDWLTEPDPPTPARRGWRRLFR